MEEALYLSLEEPAPALSYSHRGLCFLPFSHNRSMFYDPGGGFLAGRADVSMCVCTCIRVCLCGRLGRAEEGDTQEVSHD